MVRQEKFENAFFGRESIYVFPSTFYLIVKNKPWTLLVQIVSQYIVFDHINLYLIAARYLYQGFDFTNGEFCEKIFSRLKCNK